MQNKPSKIVKWVLILSITLVLNLFINYAISLVYEAPEYPEYDIHPKVLTEGMTVENEAQQLEAEEKWDAQYEVYEVERDLYERNVFVILISAGVLILLLSLLFKGNAVLATAFALASLLDFIIASLRYWSSAHSITRVVILLIALVILISIAYKKFGDTSRSEN